MQANSKLRDPFINHNTNMNQGRPDAYVEPEPEEEEEEEEEEPSDEEKPPGFSPPKKSESETAMKPVRPQTVRECKIPYDPLTAADRFRSREMIECPFLV